MFVAVVRHQRSTFLANFEFLSYVYTGYTMKTFLLLKMVPLKWFSMYDI